MATSTVSSAASLRLFNSSSPSPPTSLLSFRLSPLSSPLRLPRPLSFRPPPSACRAPTRKTTVAMAVERKGSSSAEPRETIMLPGCDYNHWLIVMEFPKDPVPTREQMIETYLNTLATVLGSMEMAKKNMYAFSTTTYTGFQCTVSEETSEKFKGLPGVLWVLPDSYIDVKNKDYGGDKYINGEIIRCQYPTYQPKQQRTSRYGSRRYERRRSGPPGGSPRPKQDAPQQSAQ